MITKYKYTNNLVAYSRIPKILEKNEEQDLINQWQKNQNQKAVGKIISSHLRLVVSIARKYFNYGLPLDDLINEGIIGIMHALNKFDLSKNFRLSTYASWWIRANIQDYILKNWSIVKNGSTSAQKSLFFNLKKLKRKINDPSLNYLGEKELNIISSMFNVKKSEIQNMESKLEAGDQYLNQTIYHDDNKIELISLLKDNSPTQDIIVNDNIDNIAKKEWIKKSMQFLKDRERIIISARQLEEKAKTLEDLGSMLGISKERVRQIEKASLKKLKKILLKISNESKEFFIH